MQRCAAHRCPNCMGVVLEEEALWIDHIKRGETRFFQELYQKHRRKLFTLCYRFTRNPVDAEDQLQEIFMRLLEKIDSFRGQSSFATWAHRLAVNHLINFTKGRQFQDAPAEIRDEAIAGDPDLSLILARAIGELPAGFRNVFILHDQEGYRHEEIAALLGCSAATSRSQLSRARLSLREKLKPVLMEMPV